MNWLRSFLLSAVFGTKSCSDCPAVWSVWSDKLQNPTNPFRGGPVAHPGIIIIISIIINMYMYVCMYVYIYIYIYMYIYIYREREMYRCVYIYIYTYIHAYIYIYIYVYRERLHTYICYTYAHVGSTRSSPGSDGRICHPAHAPAS